MAPTITNLRTEEGVTFSQDFTLSNSYGVAPENYTGALSIREYPDAESADLSITTTANDNGSVITLSGTAASITITVLIVADDMAELVEGRYVYDILLTDTSGNVRMPFAGEINNRRLITR